MRRGAVRGASRSCAAARRTHAPRKVADGVGLSPAPCAEYAGFKCGLVTSVEDLADKLKVSWLG